MKLIEIFHKKGILHLLATIICFPVHLMVQLHWPKSRILHVEWPWSQAWFTRNIFCTVLKWVECIPLVLFTHQIKGAADKNGLKMIRVNKASVSVVKSDQEIKTIIIHCNLLPSTGLGQCEYTIMRPIQILMAPNPRGTLVLYKPMFISLGVRQCEHSILVHSHCPRLTPRLINKMCSRTQWKFALFFLWTVWTPPHNSSQASFYRSQCRRVWTHHWKAEVRSEFAKHMHPQISKCDVPISYCCSMGWKNYILQYTGCYVSVLIACSVLMCILC